jgi:polyketide synthase PksN
MLDLELDLDDGIWDGISSVSVKDIAVIGMDVRLPQSGSAEQFWDNLRKGKDCVGEFPEGRKPDIEQYHSYRDPQAGGFQYGKGGYLDRIDSFDHQFFKISKKEADLMDPNQCIFLETAWKAIEDAGYGGTRLTGSKTGVYVGFTPRGEYRQFIAEVEPDSSAVAEAGNLSAIVASRISYLLDLHGPSMIVNTECSSSLVAVHLACRSLQNAECDMAIAGGVRLSFSPLITGGRLGIESEQGKVCTFDDDSDGAVFGEGSVALILKPLHAAVQDGDHIYAVIKGSAVNQDGASLGITAPNILAQEAVIVDAWKDAGIDPETISYIEAHGTGTRLGDPIEMDALNLAFSRYTSRKQFCGVGSVKTNIAHLDNVSGMASLVKLILALQHRQLPPSLHFKKPNRNIDFENSALYVNHRLREWQVEQGPRRAGVSSFGLSGTNCHLIVEEAPAVSQGMPEASAGAFLFTLSAANERLALRLAEAMHDRIASDTTLEPGSICRTVNTGRGHYAFRIAFPVQSREQLLETLQQICAQGLRHCGAAQLHWGEHHLVPDNKPLPQINEIYSAQHRELSLRGEQCLKQLAGNPAAASPELLSALAELYVQGAKLAWEELYFGRNYDKVSLPTYPFEPTRCWLTLSSAPVRASEIGQGKTCSHPLLDRLLVQTIDQDIYISRFNVDKHWVLKEHCLADTYILPGTAYLEMARECANRYMVGGAYEFRNVHFLQSLTVEPGETKSIQTVLTRHKEHMHFRVAGSALSAGGDGLEWTVYCEGNLAVVPEKSAYQVDMQVLSNQCPRELDLLAAALNSTEAKLFQFGPRWTQVTRSVRAGETEVLTKLQLPDEYHADLEEYRLHPSLLDMAINAITQSTGNGVYLPLSYDSFTIYGDVGGALWSYVRRTDSSANLEVVSYDVLLMDADGKVLGEVSRLTTKKVHHKAEKAKEAEYYRVHYMPEPLQEQKSEDTSGYVLILAAASNRSRQIIQAVKRSGRKVIEVHTGTSYSCDETNRYTVGYTQDDYERLFRELEGLPVQQVVHLLTADPLRSEDSADGLESCLEAGTYSLFNLVKALAPQQYPKGLDIVTVSLYARYVDPGQAAVHPAYASMIGLCRVINQEFSHLRLRTVDMDELTPPEQIAAEINAPSSPFYTAYRSGRRYIEILEEAEAASGTDYSGRISEGGVYVITGGTGSIGLRVAAGISEIKPVRLVLISRTGDVPDSGAEQSLLTAKQQDARSIIRSIRESGSTVHCYAADVADQAAMALIFKTVRAELGPIKGIIHSAGIAGDGYFLPKTAAAFRQVLLPKVQGTQVLAQLSEKDELDFFISFSSISSVYGYPGQSDYVAANAYLDAFQGYCQLKGRQAVTINWAPWLEAGMALDHQLADNGVFRMLSTEAALKGFNRALTVDQGNIIIGSLNAAALHALDSKLPFRLSESLSRRIFTKSSIPDVSTGRRSSGNNTRKSPDLRGNADEEYSETQRVLARVWGSVLGMQEVDIYGSFMDQGGDSILAVELLKQIELEYPGLVSISDIFSYPSVSELAALLDSKMQPAASEAVRSSAAGNAAASLLDALDQLAKGTLTLEEAEKFLL